MTTAAELREDLLEFVQRDLIGPAHGDDEVLDDPPRIRYGAGVLFPQESGRNESEAVSGVEGDGDTTGEPSSEEVPERPDSVAAQKGLRDEVTVDSKHDDAVTLANSYRPSAMGLSFIAEALPSGLGIQARAAIYEPRTQPSEDGNWEVTTWTRRQLPLPSVHVHLDAGSGPEDHDLAEGLKLRIVARPRETGRFLVTVSLYNTTAEHTRRATTFFQTGLEVVGTDEDAPFQEYRTLAGIAVDDEELSLQMLYRKQRVFAVGHGCAAAWAAPIEDCTTRIRTDVLPCVTIPPIVPLAPDRRYLNMQFLSGSCEEPESEIPEALEEFCREYDDWIAKRDAEVPVMEPRFRDMAIRHLTACRITAERMRGGIEFLRSDSLALEAFMLVNRVMLMQQRHSRFRRQLGESWTPLPTTYEADWDAGRGYWRAFQLAFILMTLPGLAGGRSTLEIDGEGVSERDLVDLIWFPTGGGKTEAYLGVTAFLILMTRLGGGEGAGCNALMRYTLRLLTIQQFQRAASLICACELIRRENPERFGATPISIGLWVGKSLTPNDEADALKCLTRLDRKQGDAKNPFQLLSCPWCGVELNNPKRLGYAEYRGRQVFLCPAKGETPEQSCPFSHIGEHLPVCVVDQTIYRQPPTLIIGTVDKFAMLAWRERAGSILCCGGGPGLIIQDELHLITGPLGSMVGLYEGVIDFLCSRSGSRPKIIASTATIRRASEQCAALYDRPMFQFPAPGLDASDSFFAVEDSHSTGRAYVGFLPTASSSPLTAQIRSVVALQQGAYIVAGDTPDEKALDPYWTLVQYFGSLKELGRAATFITADIPEFLPTMHRRYALEGDRRRWMRTAEELTSRKNEDEIPKILQRLEDRYANGATWDDQALDTVLATNMISVGVDVDRLGLMMVVTQPKGTSEYIQASSRVGRSKQAPGLVFTLYSAGRPRDRSHYEQFRSFHNAFYRHVEPTSVTPFAPSAMERALHAVLVIAGRHVAGWGRPRDFGRADPDFDEFLDFLRARVRSVDPDHEREFEDLLDDRLTDWEQRLPERWGDFGGSSDDRTLMRVAGTAASEDDPDSWETPTSMRNVDVECSADVVARYVVPEAGE